MKRKKGKKEPLEKRGRVRKKERTVYQHTVLVTSSLAKRLTRMIHSAIILYFGAVGRRVGEKHLKKKRRKEEGENVSALH